MFLYANNFTKYQPIFIIISLSGTKKCSETVIKDHHTLYKSLHYLVKCQTSHLSRRRHWPIAVVNVDRAWRGLQTART